MFIAFIIILAPMLQLPELCHQRPRAGRPAFRQKSPPSHLFRESTTELPPAKWIAWLASVCAPGPPADPQPCSSCRAYIQVGIRSPIRRSLLTPDP